MKMYKALINIGDYKKGDTVPTELAESWIEMFKISPVEKSEKKEVAVSKKKKSKK